MGRQAYLNRLALGRSPYEAPERPADPAVDLGSPTQQRVSPRYADGYVQHYDERGHPINPESKSFGRELRRAKNDILSTMGIVVSEDGNASGLSEQQKIDIIAAENDYGLVMATLDHVSAFLGSWWTSSLTGRIQTFRSYTHIPLMGIIAHERASYGILGFYFAGIPAWALSTCLSICRHHPLERLISSLQSRFPDNDVLSKLVRSSFTILHSAARGTLLVLAIQSYVYSLLQSLHLVHPYGFPGIRFLAPLGELTTMLLPPIPAAFTLQSVGDFCLNLLKAPPLLVYLYVYLRPVIEIRLYRLIRRRLPKPTLADELSIKVALENDLIDWMAPTLGRRSEEENRRNNLSLLEDLMCEVKFLQGWMLSWFGVKTQRTSAAPEQAADSRRRQEWLESLPISVEQLQNERQNRTRRLQQAVPPAPEEVVQAHEAARSGQPSTPVTAPVPDSGFDFSGDRVLSNEDEIHQSPAQMSTGGLSEMAPLGRTSDSSPAANVSPAVNTEAHGEHDAHEGQRNSRSNTLFSRQSSPETSSPTSPHVRASLIHQNSDIITMQLELLGNRNAQNPGQLRPRPGNDIDFPTSNGETGHRRSITELLDTILAHQNQSLSTIVHSDAVDSDGLSNMTPGASPGNGEDVLGLVPQGQQEARGIHDFTAESPVEGPSSSLANILPESVEEPPSQEDTRNHPSEAEPTGENDFDSGIYPRISDPNVREGPSENTNSSSAHRITILSSHPVDSLASHLASMITTVLFIPLESLYLRSLASSYLSSNASSAADVRTLGALGGGGSRSDMLAYMGKLALMMGLHAAVNAGVWGVISGTAIRIGRRFCGWGTL
ncbi:hypothetical protein ANOM_007170 [Aspergillus nomiae NRRL 13137]|uniref:Uncharacterized protein n=1 Tax=Aspergillus nomiae NRRL (strain ATCC 15546 / NRRL 13137 / CBS 260.88 / M93) TaxID=1509407 RepID=A0A0L1IXI9_ASPN3|nr:uncharacterized protein ANOM_007170 [Aspergillus nomiae NRRL 13137]KNG84125.1 hypothetical protein ANOM_007170 [Aspergillus nomiae NRRL 13137]